jgi:hypothetical protein
VSAVKYEHGFYIPEDDILQGDSIIANCTADATESRKVKIK